MIEFLLVVVVHVVVLSFIWHTWLGVLLAAAARMLGRESDFEIDWCWHDDRPGCLDEFYPNYRELMVSWFLLGDEKGGFDEWYGEMVDRGMRIAYDAHDGNGGLFVALSMSSHGY